jgi:hypothetical protein
LKARVGPPAIAGRSRACQNASPRRGHQPRCAACWLEGSVVERRRRWLPTCLRASTRLPPGAARAAGVAALTLDVDKHATRPVRLALGSPAPTTDPSLPEANAEPLEEHRRAGMSWARHQLSNQFRYGSKPLSLMNSSSVSIAGRARE